eukprot:6179664-Pleurochrysis_carterae.AAC.1
MPFGRDLALWRNCISGHQTQQDMHENCQRVRPALSRFSLVVHEDSDLDVHKNPADVPCCTMT